MNLEASRPALALLQSGRAWLDSLSHTWLALLARVAMALVFWTSGQTKIEGLALNPVTLEFQWGWPRLSDSAIALFRDEYRLPWLSPELAAGLAAVAEHALPLLLLLGLASRLSALGLLGMTAVIQLLVYPGAFVTHATWAVALLLVITRGPGKLAVDHWLAGRFQR